MNLNLRSIIWMGFLGRVLLAFWVATVDQIHGTASDVERLHGIAQVILNGLTDLYPQDLSVWGVFYAYFLSYVYALTTDSQLIANIVACVAWLFSAFVLLRIMNLFSLNYKNMFMVLILYILLPSSLLYTSVGLREAYMLLLVNLSIYLAIIFYYHRDIRAFLLLTGVLGLVLLLHVTFIVYAVFLISITLLATALRNFNIKIVKALPYLILGAMVSIFFVQDFLQSTVELGFSEGIMAAVLNFQEGSVITGMESRATYKFLVPEEVGFLSSITYVGFGFFQYLFEPMPWRVSNFMDVILTLENILRGIMIFLGIKALFFTQEDNKKILLTLLFSFLVLEFTWSVGTTNWGTASRHHVPSLGLLLLLGFIFKDSLEKTKNMSIKKLNSIKLSKNL